MLFAIHCPDREDTATLRESLRELHAAHMRRHADRIVFGGPLLGPDEKSRIGVLAEMEETSAC